MLPMLAGLGGLVYQQGTAIESDLVRPIFQLLKTLAAEFGIKLDPVLNNLGSNIRYAAIVAMILQWALYAWVLNALRRIGKEWVRKASHGKLDNPPLKGALQSLVLTSQ